MNKKLIEVIVGLFIIAGVVALAVMAFKVSGLTKMSNGDTYTLRADFDNVGGLKVRAPVAISGVKIGQVSRIDLDKDSFRARVYLSIDNQYNNIPIDTAASIFTQGILGSNYISLSPGFETQNFKNNDMIETTHPALILENLIGQLIYSLKGNNKETEPGAPATDIASPAAPTEPRAPATDNNKE